MQFQIVEATDAKLATVTNRVEKHGPQEVPAVSFTLRFRSLDNTVLDMLSKTLRKALYAPVVPEGQAPLPGVEELPTPILRCQDLGPLELKKVCEGWHVEIEHGPDPDRALCMDSCKIDGFVATLHDGGRVDLECRVGTADIDGEGVGLLWEKQRQTVAARIIAPNLSAAPAPSPAAAASQAHQRSAEAAGQQRIDADDDEALDDDDGPVPGDFSGFEPVLLDRDTLPAELRGKHPERWIVQFDEDEFLYFGEDDRAEAVEELHAQRVAVGLDPETGQPVDSDGELAPDSPEAALARTVGAPPGDGA